MASSILPRAAAPARFEMMTYWKNLAMARESFPAAPLLTAQDRILVLSPHCDDETLGVGGTLAAARARGLAVRVAFMTNGDGSRSTQIAETARRLRRSSFLQLAAMRQRETVAALSELGVAREEIVFLGYPDGGMQAMWQTHWTSDAPYRSPFTGADHSPYPDSLTRNAPYCGEAALRDVLRLIEEFRPTVVFTTHPCDTHPDHWAAYAYTRAALETLRLRPDTAAWARRVRLLTFLVHHGVWPAPHGYHPDAQLAPPAGLKNIGTHWMQTPLDESSRRTKEAALSRYVSQMTFTPHYLRGFLRRNELFGVVPVEASPAQASPAESLSSRRNGHSPRPPIAAPVIDMVRDQARDSLPYSVWAAADLQKVSWRPSNAPDRVTLRIGLGRRAANATASGRLHYRLLLHVLTARSARAWTVVVRGRGSSLHALLQPTAWRSAGQDASAHALTARYVADDLEIEIPRAALGLEAETKTSTAVAARADATVPRASGADVEDSSRDSLKDSSGLIVLLVSASTHFGGKRLDQTATGALRLALE